MNEHPTTSQIDRGSRLWHIRTGQFVTLCRCASVADYRKVGWAKSHPSEYYLAAPVAAASSAEIPNLEAPDAQISV